MSQRPIRLTQLRAIEDQVREMPAPKQRQQKRIIIQRGSRRLSTALLLLTGGVLAATLLAVPAPKTGQVRSARSHNVVHRSVTGVKKTAVASLQDTTLPKLNNGAACTAGTILTTVAHEDDDILFMNPDISQEISAGKCMRTVYLTAGDDGQPASYWQEREHGPEAAYAAMYNVPNVWTQATALVNGHPVTYYTLDGQPLISLVFLRLPDGGLSGGGFASNHNESLLKLRNNLIPTMTTVDGATSYTKTALLTSLGAIMELDKPTIINTQAFSSALATGDHSDHQVVGYLTSLAQQTYSPSSGLIRYIGYQSNSEPVNITQSQIAAKQSIFSAYQVDDQNICDNMGDCSGAETYQGYTMRQYRQADPVIGTTPNVISH